MLVFYGFSPKFYIKKERKILYALDCIQDCWRYRPDLNWGMRVLQTLALPLGYGTI